MSLFNSKAFKEVAEEQIKFKQIKFQLKVLGFDSKKAGYMADTFTQNNACWFLNHFKIHVIRVLSTAPPPPPPPPSQRLSFPQKKFY